ncbi:hypothetical protein IZ6_26730 [Terrihabitans soli]|uniref:Uncharacterized protein n=1 Tax=Terrihabitans soli TaxID=708113 RepID=A0A6S6QZ82_9HYPH|nr:hypothetical protein [Terrihabitans soli]BCJ91938.1 hypothetical protein IZ6_26730 [Terrihabitans soli]
MQDAEALLMSALKNVWPEVCTILFVSLCVPLLQLNVFSLIAACVCAALLAGVFIYRERRSAGALRALRREIVRECTDLHYFVQSALRTPDAPEPVLPLFEELVP